MHQYGLAFGFREPYQVLLSSEIIKDAARCKMRLGSMLEGTLHGQIKPMITQCCIRHLYNAQDGANQAEKDAWIAVAKEAERRRCGHHELEEPLSELDCLKSTVDPKGSGNNKNCYVIATQDVEVRKWMRANVAGVPLIYVQRSVMILEPMSGRTEDVKSAEEKRKYRAGLRDTRGAKSTGEKRKREEDDDGEERDEEETNGETHKGEAADSIQTPKKKKAKGPRGPNPLSVKKGKKEKKEKNGHPKIPVKHWKVEKATEGSDPSAESGATKPRAQESKYERESIKRKRKRAAKSEAAADTTDRGHTNGVGGDS
jgi:U3 small nucleolar RNA-associated protein 23